MNLIKSLTLKPETIKLLKAAGILIAALYASTVLLFAGAGTLFDFQQALIWSEQLSLGLRAGIGWLVLGVLFMECR